MSTSRLFFPLSNGRRQLGQTSADPAEDTAGEDLAPPEDMRRRTALRSARAKRYIKDEQGEKKG